jgi:uncharacterized protein involved in outer membrane biogenesis
MKKILLGVVVVLLVAVLAATGYGIHLVRKLNTPEFQKSLLDQAKAAVGADVRVKEMDISLFSGVTLKGLVIANPAPFAGDLLTADAFVLRYRLRPLLAGRVEVERIALEKPALNVAMDAKGVFNYEKLGGPAPKKPSAAAPAGAAAVPLRVVLKQLTVENGSVTLTDPTKVRLLAVEGAGFRSAFEVEGGVARGSGEAAIPTVSLGDLLFLRSVRAPLSLSKEAVTLSPIRADLAKGRVTGDVTIHLKGGFRYVAKLEVKGVDVSTLLAEAKSAGGVAGTLAAQATFEGSGGLPTMKGRGQGTVADCRVEQGRVLALLAAVLQMPELAKPDFDECRAEFTQSGRRVSTPVLLLTGEAVQLSGAGTVNLETTALDYRMTLALAPRLFAKVTRRELRPAFKERADGYAAIDFRLYGTTSNPKTDLLARVGTAAATDAVQKGLDRLFKKRDQ